MNADFSVPNKKYRWLGIALVFCITLISALYQTERVGAVAVTTDFAFGTNGVVQTDIASYETTAQDMAIQGDGKIVVVGYAYAPSNPANFTVTRYNSNGSLDTSFDSDGIVTGHFRITGSYTASYGRTLAIQTDGKIVVAGDSYVFENNQGTTDFGVARLNPDGSFDNSFDGDGRVNFSAATTQHDQAYQVAVQPGGKIVVCGNVGNGSNTFAPAVARLDPNGSLDTTFFEDGVVDYVNDIYGSPSALYIQSDGKINVVTDIVSPSPDALTIFLRYNADGSPDTTFGIGGRRSTGALGRVNSIGFQPDGKIILGSQFFTVVRLNSDYSLDTSFGNNGGATVSFGQYFNWMNDLAVQPDGKIVVVGYTNTEAGFNVACDFTLARFNADGTLDTTFDLDGKIVASVGSRIERAEAVRVLPNGKILMVGKAGETSVVGKATLMRFMGDINTADFDGDTKTDVSVFRPSTGAWYLSQSESGFSAVNWGLGSDKLVPGDYTGDGRTDIAVFRPSTGVWYVFRSSDNSVTTTAFGATGDVPAAGAFDGDAQADFAIFRPSTGQWWIRRTTNPNNFLVTNFGSNGDVPVQADYDADGITDIAVWRPATGTWYRLNSATNSVSLTQFGLNNDIPTVGDFDGDGRSDLAVFRPSNNTWYLSRTTSGLFITQWGASGDIPAVGDYDGDGRDDIAVWRPASGTWYVSQSSNGAALIRQYGLNGDLPIPAYDAP